MALAGRLPHPPAFISGREALSILKAEGLGPLELTRPAVTGLSPSRPRRAVRGCLSPQLSLGFPLTQARKWAAICPRRRALCPG